MAPARPLKRQKTNTAEVPQTSQVQAAQVPLPPVTPSEATISSPTAPTPPKQEARSSFFSRTWPRKAAPHTDVARESATSTTSTAQETAVVVREKIRPQRSPSIAMTLGKSSSYRSNRSLPADATATLVNATPKNPIENGASKSQAEPSGESKDEESVNKVKADVKGISEPKNEVPATLKPEPLPAGQPQQPLPQEGQAGWLAWLSRRDIPANKPSESQLLTQQELTDTPKTPINGSVNPPDKMRDGSSAAQNAVEQPPEENTEQTVPSPPPNNKRSWYQMWNSDTSTVPGKTEQPNKQPQRIDAASQMPPNTPTQYLHIPSTPKSKEASQASSLETSPPPPLPGDASKSSGWVFWSRDRNQPATAKSDSDPHVGEIAISDTPSQARPKRASISLPDEERKPVFQPALQEQKSKKGKDPKSIQADTASAKKQSEKDSETKELSTLKSAKKTTRGTLTKAESSKAAATAREPVEVSTPRAASPVPTKTEVPNLLLPQFTDTLSPEEHPSILQQLARLLYYTKEPDFKHLHIVKDPPRIANALAIGVHGYFPAPLIRSVLGQPTGTSIKFADMAASAIKRWTKNRGFNCEVKSAALEGEGRIAERVELLWKLLLNWIDEIRKSDFVMIACHSQGVPVAIMLVAKLIAFGCISGARVGICAMAGVNMGPFQEYKSRWISGSAGELFEFSDPNSKVSTDYMAATEEILKHGVRLTYTGSIDDQLVSMESSIFAPITHPHIYRAVFIDGRIHAPNFLSHLVGFALKLRNVGVPDHGLIRELSPPLAGSLYTGEGHSRIYDDDTVYDLAIAFALETNTLKEVPVSKRPTASNAANPYILPFAMRGILEEDYVKTELQAEARDLLAQFDDWKPTTKALKDVKFRLEGIRSKL
ncbi:uncharacterized protein A1O9_10453 [Exophiala aquamarina CBS 119918]|uniref:YMC020W-like alpha/beta hydrolase domain-containing protein n=1 Tax=Exophiala aquamarina CBS 119918 TaxID=1182545 RepID=A0A072P2G8_9EURO|nr:uncharacterized protein A1O9_10453 [Exophiala aquamarina CBS 119918]KEF53478.1 hypothetical protein A1O9_10453 [Exophiala aquamarina CBS 119918]